MADDPALVDAARDAIRAASRVVFFTGAGMSAESGIPTFRDALTGLWERFDPASLASAEGYEADPALVWGWYEWRRQKVMQALEEAMRADRAPNKILQFNDFGLVAITRKRVKQSLERTLCSPCPTCEGSGYTKSVQTVIGESLMEAGKLAPHIEGKELMLRVHPTVAVTLKSKDNDYLEELEEIFGRPVLVTGDDSIHPEKFDLAGSR